MMTERRVPPKLWVPGESEELSTSLNDALDAYTIFLEIQHPSRLHMFQNLCKANPDGATAEAVVFSWMRAERFHPELAENPSTGGVDFRCNPPAAMPFLLEVTSLDEKAISARSGLPDQVDETCRSFGMVTENLWSKARKKAPQLANGPLPRVLAVCLMHTHARELLGTTAAEWFMTSEPKIKIPIGSSKAKTLRVADLRRAAFLRIENGRIAPARQSISTILLVSIWNNGLEVVGMLHPDPVIAFDYHTLGYVPFLRVSDWPIAGDTLGIEWVVGDPKPHWQRHIRATLDNDELRGSGGAS